MNFLHDKFLRISYLKQLCFRNDVSLMTSHFSSLVSSSQSLIHGLSLIVVHVNSSLLLLYASCVVGTTFSFPNFLYLTSLCSTQNLLVEIKGTKLPEFKCQLTVYTRTLEGLLSVYASAFFPLN